MKGSGRQIQTYRLPGPPCRAPAGVPSNGGAALTADHLEAAEAQLVAVWQRVQADLLHCQQRLPRRRARISPKFSFLGAGASATFFDSSVVRPPPPGGGGTVLSFHGRASKNFELQN